MSINLRQPNGKPDYLAIAFIVLACYALICIGC